MEDEMISENTGELELSPDQISELMTHGEINVDTGLGFLKIKLLLEWS